MQFTRVLWEQLGWQTSYPDDSITVKHISTDTRRLRNDCVFFSYSADPATAVSHIFTALKKGVVAVFIRESCRKEVEESPYFNKNKPIFYCNDFLRIAGETISFMHDDPSRKMFLFGITGTNGKTTIALALYQLLEKMGKPSVYVGTLGAISHDKKYETGLTTPDIITVERVLQNSLRRKITYAAIEASSHGLQQGRLAGLFWNVGIFTNLTQDHLDYHGNMDNYYRAKLTLFEDMIRLSRKDPGSVKGAVISVTDEFGRKLYDYMKKANPGFPVVGLGARSDASLHEIIPEWSGYRAKLVFAQKTYMLKTSFIGIVNLYNLSAVFLALLFMGFPAENILEKLAEVEPVAGRYEVIKAPGNRHVIVDYAHTPDALEKTLMTLQELGPSRVIVLFGCGGNRDKGKRNQMGRIATSLADFTIITNDNPRDEDPQSIIEDIKSGCEGSRFVVLQDREKAIRAGIQILGQGEVLLIAGKGHETYQIIGKKTTKFSDKDVAQKLISHHKFEVL